MSTKLVLKVSQALHRSVKSYGRRVRLQDSEEGAEGHQIFYRSAFKRKVISTSFKAGRTKSQAYRSRGFKCRQGPTRLIAFSRHSELLQRRAVKPVPYCISYKPLHPHETSMASPLLTPLAPAPKDTPPSSPMNRFSNSVTKRTDR